MNEGRIEQCADPETVYDRPATTFVAGFIGVSNLMPAEVKGSNEIQVVNGPLVPTPDAASTRWREVFCGSASGEADGFAPGERAIRPARRRRNRRKLVLPRHLHPDGGAGHRRT